MIAWAAFALALACLLLLLGLLAGLAFGVRKLAPVLRSFGLLPPE